MLIAKLSAGDMTVMDAVYHTSCLVSLYKLHRDLSIKQESTEECHLKSLEGIVLGELITFTESSRKKRIALSFKLSELKNVYASRFQEINSRGYNACVSTARLKERILNMMPELSAHKCS